MRPNAVVEEIPQFDAVVVGITCLNGVPAGIIFFHQGKMLNAEFKYDQTGALTAGIGKRTLTTIDAPDGMHAKITGKRITRDYSKDFRSVRETATTYEVVSLDLD